MITLEKSAASLDHQIERARKEIASDGYDMSVGELLNLYRDNELIINPDFQRLFRWTALQKTRFVESLLLGIPVPPIFVFQESGGSWELIDGLQRLSTIFEFVGILKRTEKAESPESESQESDSPESESSEPVTLLGTSFLPGLEGRAWEPNSKGIQGIGRTAQLSIKRARIRVEILKKESDPAAKYELFQRLNTGGTALSEQEVRNCSALMINPDFQRWLVRQSGYGPFGVTTSQTEDALKRQSGVELVLRFVAFRNVAYQPGLDVHEYLHEALYQLASNKGFAYLPEEEVFRKTFRLLEVALGADAFKRWDGEKFTGKFLMSLYEVNAVGVSRNIVAIENLGTGAGVFIAAKAKELWSNEVFRKNSGAGVRGTTRLTNLLPMAAAFFRP